MMSKLRKVAFVGLLFLLFAFKASSSNPDMLIIKERIINGLLKSGVNDDQISDLVSTINSEGFWPEINYTDLSRTAFENAKHTSRLVAMSRAWRNPNSSFYKSGQLLKTIESALAFWVKNDFICENWWNNEIGTPSDIAYVLLLVGDELPKELTQKTQPIVGRAHLNASGARPSGDRIKIAEILARNLLFLGDEKQFGEVVKVIEGEIKFETGRGMQYDYSFHHREDWVNNTLSYGLQFADVFAVWADYVANTQYSFSQEKIKILVDYYLDGICKMTAFGKYPDLGAKNREISRPEALSAMGTNTPQKLLNVTNYRRKDIEEIIASRNKNIKPKEGYSKFFWHSEYFSHQRPKYFTSVRMFSKRNANMEMPYNGEGLLNHHLGDGANYVYIEGTEYYNIFPFFDWQKIPGTTVLQKPEMIPEKNIQKWGSTTFVGGVTDGKYGAVANDFVSPHDGTKAKKSYFFFDEEYVCLGSGISSDKSYPVITTINQTYLNGDIIVAANKRKNIIGRGERSLNNPDWILHNTIGYIFPKPQNIKLSNQLQKGNWFSINRQTGSSKEIIEKDIFKLWIEHGTSPQNEKYEYVIYPSVTEKQLERKFKKNAIKVLSNTDDIQAVKHNKLNIVQAIFYKSGRLSLSNEHYIECKEPCMIMLTYKKNRITKITLSDPNRNRKKIEFSLTTHLRIDQEGVTSSWHPKNNTTSFFVQLPTDAAAGQSVILLLN